MVKPILLLGNQKLYEKSVEIQKFELHDIKKAAVSKIISLLFFDLTA